MAEDYGLLEPAAAEGVGDEWAEIDVSDTAADEVARRRDREFSQFRERIKDSERLKVDDSVFDDATYAAIYRLVQLDFVDALGGVLSTGKEANVYEALGGAAAADALGVADPTVAIKVYRINASNFQDMRAYLAGDPRFDGIKGDKKAVVLAWVRKEFANLGRARRAGVRVPQPLAVERNAMVMEYIGAEADRALRLSEVSLENPEMAYRVVREYARRLYDAGLVHGDLSEYNVVVHEGTLYVLDLGQAVTVHHPNSREFLERDCENVASFFRRQGVDADTDDLLAFVTGDDG